MPFRVDGVEQQTINVDNIELNQMRVDGSTVFESVKEYYLFDNGTVNGINWIFTSGQNPAPDHSIGNTIKLDGTGYSVHGDYYVYLDVTNFKKIHFNVTSSHRTSNTHYKVGITSKIASYYAGSVLVNGAEDYSVRNGDNVFDVSGLTGNYYVLISISTGSSGDSEKAGITVNKVWFEY